MVSAPAKLRRRAAVHDFSHATPCGPPRQPPAPRDQSLPVAARAQPGAWYPWGEEAFAKARAEDKPILLSVGYATCHWCHVMERESFEDVGLARQLADGFVAIKVDREELPDVDHVYMSALQALTGRGGWPMRFEPVPDDKPSNVLRNQQKMRQRWADVLTRFPQHGRDGRQGRITHAAGSSHLLPSRQAAHLPTSGSLRSANRCSTLTSLGDAGLATLGRLIKDCASMTLPTSLQPRRSPTSMDIRQLEYFIHVAELGSFTRASEVLGVAQSALSRHVRKLEVELRQHLLHRDGRGAIPTNAGKRLLAHGRGILLQIQRATEDMAESRGAPVGHVVVGLPHSLGRILTVPFVLEFRREFPQATLSITEGLTIHLHEWLTSGRLDLALLHDPTPSSILETLPLQRDELFLLSPATARPRRKAVSLDQLATLPLILPRAPHPLRMLIETRLANIGKRPDITLEIDAVPAIADLVAQGLGFAVVTKNAARVTGEAARFHFTRIVAPDLGSTLVLARSAERPPTALTQRVYELMRDFVQPCLKRANP